MHRSPPGDAESARFEPDALAALPSELALSRLPVGRHGLPRSFVVRNQRLRLIAAMLRVLPRCGYPATTIGHVTREAGVSRSAFYSQFEGKEDCFLATYDLAAEWLCERIESTACGEEEWPVRVQTGISEALQLLAANPDVAHLLAIEAQRAGPAARERQRAFLGRFAASLRVGRPGRPGLPAELEELLLGGLFAHIARYVDAGDTERLPKATAELIQYLLIPYLDPDEIGRLADRAA